MLTKHDLSEKMIKLISLAEAGDARAQCNLGNCYDSGKGVPKDYIKAVELYRSAAEQKNPRAQYNLALMYTMGRGVPQDPNEEEKWLFKAAEQGYPGAQIELTQCYYRWGISRIPEDEKKWHLKMTEQVFPPDKITLTKFYDRYFHTDARKTLTYGAALISRGLFGDKPPFLPSLDPPPLDRLREIKKHPAAATAVRNYLLGRFNESFEYKIIYCFALVDTGSIVDLSKMTTQMGFPMDGTFCLCPAEYNSKNPENYVCYLEGPLDKKWMKEQDERYLADKAAKFPTEQKPQEPEKVTREKSVALSMPVVSIVEQPPVTAIGTEVILPPEGPAPAPVTSALPTSFPIAPLLSASPVQQGPNLSQVTAEKDYLKAKLAISKLQYEKAAQYLQQAINTYKQLVDLGVENSEKKLSKVELTMNKVQIELGSSTVAGEAPIPIIDEATLDIPPPPLAAPPAPPPPPVPDHKTRTYAKTLTAEIESDKNKTPSSVESPALPPRKELKPDEPAVSTNKSGLFSQIHGFDKSKLRSKEQGEALQKVKASRKKCTKKLDEFRASKDLSILGILRTKLYDRREVIDKDSELANSSSDSEWSEDEKP